MSFSDFRKTKKFNIILTSAILLLALVVTVWSGIHFKKFVNYEVEFKFDETLPGHSIEKFSKYSPKLEGTVGDSNIYIIDSGVPGPSILIMGGTHPNEPSGQLTATLLLENIEVTKGKVFIITEANRSAYTHSNPLEASSEYYTIKNQNGEDRVFKFGSRATNTNEQWPNPDVYVHATSGQKLSSTDTRNLNRAYPGSENGTYTERVAYAITQCIIQNNITITIDLHEASPEYLTINAIICNSVYMADAGTTAAKKIATRAQMKMEDNDVLIKVEDSPANLHGLTHRELGTYTNSLVFLCETSNASQGKIRGAFTSDLITSGNDKFYSKLVERDNSDNDPTNNVIYAAPCDISVRVARHVYAIMEIINGYNKIYNSIVDLPQDVKDLGKLEVEGIPSYEEIIENGIGKYLK